MKTTRSISDLPGLLFLALGILAGTLLTAGLTWAGLEASQYGFVNYTNEHFDGLSCPALMTRSETGVVRVAVHNPSSMVITPIMTIDVSTPGQPETRTVQVTVPSGQTQAVEWSVSPKNIDRYFFIFVKVNRSPSYPMPQAEALCGILVLDVPFPSGTLLQAIWLGLCLVCIPLGLWLWGKARGPAYEMPGVTRALAATALTGLLVSLLGWWLPGLLCLVLTALLCAGLVTTLIKV